jgi:hypothetical protein
VLSISEAIITSSATSTTFGSVNSTLIVSLPFSAVSVPLRRRPVIAVFTASAKLIAFPRTNADDMVLCMACQITEPTSLNAV